MEMNTPIQFEFFKPKRNEEIFVRRQLQKWLAKHNVKYKLILEKDYGNSLYYCYFRVWNSREQYFIFESAKNLQDLLLKALRKLESKLSIWRYQPIGQFYA